MRRAIPLLPAILLLHCAGPRMNPDLITRAERTNFRETSRYEDVRRNLDALCRNPWARVISLGTSHEGREIAALILNSRGHFVPEQARADGNPIVLVVANIHAGEVEGKEVCVMLARDILFGPLRRFAEDLTLVIVPIYNVDGNERISPENRKLDLANHEGQVGPEGGVGIRHTAEGYDLNREYMNLQAAEARALERFYLEWWPHLTIDLHTTDGSLHGFQLTYGTAQNPAGHPGPAAFVRDRLLPEVTRRLEERTGLHTFFYGNFRDENDPSQGWETYPHLPRFGSHYRGLTNRMDVLSEAYSYIPFDERVRVTYEFVREILDYVRENAADVIRTCDEAEADTLAGRPEEVGVRYEIAAWDAPAVIRGQGEGATYTIPHFGRFAPTRVVRRPWAYLVDRRLEAVANKLRDHGIAVERLTEAATLEVEQYRVDEVTAIQRTSYVNPRQNQETQLRVTAAPAHVAFPEGTYVVRMNQRQANVALYLLEPESDDGLVAWNYLDDVLRAGEPYPVWRAATQTDLPTGR